MIVISSTEKLEIGDVRIGLTDAQENNHETAFKVIAQSTRQKYIECLCSHEGFVISSGPYYYEVLVD